MNESTHPGLNLPASQFDLRTHNDATEVFDTIRKQWLVLTPEEWVRQHMVRYLTEHLGYPPGLTSIEKGFELNGIPYRADIVTYDRSGAAILAVECKAPDIRIGQKTFDQLGQYNKVIGARFLIITNGLLHFCMEYDTQNQWSQIERIPAYVR